jgi:hypothetical protein
MWPYVNYILWIIKQAYELFENRVTSNGYSYNKTDMIKYAIGNLTGTFSVAELKEQCPDVSMDMIRKILKKLQSENKIECLGTGRNARWHKIAY